MAKHAWLRVVGGLGLALAGLLMLIDGLQGHDLPAALALGVALLALARSRTPAPAPLEWIDQVALPLLRVSSDNTIAHNNAHTRELLGDTTGQPLDAVLAPEHIAAARHALSLARGTPGSTLSREWLFHRPDRTPLWADVQLTADTDGRVLLALHNTTLAHLTRQALVESQRTVSRIAGTLPGILIIFDLHNRHVTYINREFAALLGYRSEILRPGLRAILRLIHREDRRRVLDAFAPLVQGLTETIEVEFRAYHQDSSVRWMLSRSMVFERDPQTGQVLKVLGVGFDITARKNAEQALQQREQFIDTIARTLPASLRAYDLDTDQFLYHNARFASMFGMTPEQANALRPSELYDRVHPDDRAFLHVQGERLNTLPDGAVDSATFRVRHADGSYRWIQSHFVSLARRPDGVVHQIVAVAFDVTEGRATADALRESEQRLRLLLNSALDGWWDWTAANDRLLVSPEFSTNCGLPLTPDGIPTTVWLAHVYPEDRPALRQAWITALKAELPLIDQQYRFRTSQQEWRWLHVRGKVITRSGEGRAERVIGTMFDITTRKQSELALAQSEERYRLITDSVNDLITRHTSDSVMTFASPASRLILDRDPTHLLGRSLYDQIHSEDQLRVRTAFATLTTPNAMIAIQYRMRHRSGAYIHVETLARAVPDPVTQAVEGWICVTRDMAQRLRAQEELLEAERLRLAMNVERRLLDLKHGFISMVSHEFRTPLSVIFTSAEMLERYFRSMSDERRQDHLHTILRQTSYMASMMEDVLLISRAESGKLPFTPTPIDLEPFCQRMIDQLSVRQPDVTRIRLAFNLVSPQAVVDEKLMQQIVMNLLSNALKYSDREVDLELFSTPDTLRLTVRDHGIGVLPEDRVELFEAFHRGSNVGQINGTGLGLAIVRYSVERHRGSLDWDSIPGEGSWFSVTLPTVPRRSDAD